MKGTHVLNLKISQGLFEFILIQVNFVIVMFTLVIADVVFQNFIYN